MSTTWLQNLSCIDPTLSAANHDGFLIRPNQARIRSHASNLAGDLYTLTKKTQNSGNYSINLSVPNFLVTARPKVPHACEVVRIFAPLFSMIMRFSGISC
jgi:hypothetical protein